MRDSSNNLDKSILFLVVFSHHLYIVAIIININETIIKNGKYPKLKLIEKSGKFIKNVFLIQ